MIPKSPFFIYYNLSIYLINEKRGKEGERRQKTGERMI